MGCPRHPEFVFANHFHRENDHIAICSKTRRILPGPIFTHHSGSILSAEPFNCDLALLPARRAYSPEGGPGFQYWIKSSVGFR